MLVMLGAFNIGVKLETRMQQDSTDGALETLRNSKSSRQTYHSEQQASGS